MQRLTRSHASGTCLQHEHESTRTSSRETIYLQVAR